MSKKPYSFCILRYAHDPIAGECLNVGVLLVSEHAAFLDVRLEYHFERLSSAFAGFEGERFKQVLRHFEAAIEQERRGMFVTKELFGAGRSDLTADRIATRVWTDAGLSFRASEPMAGLSDDLPGMLAALFDRFVTSQYHREHELIETLWNSIGPNQLILPESHRSALDESLAHYRRDPDAGRSWDQVRDDLFPKR
jgi:putative addiction module component (TIGR02574 family)